MTHIPDLAKHTYLGMDDDNVFSVGWLNFHERFTMGKTTPELINKLKELPITQKCRGSHYCPWCILKYTSGPDESPHSNPNVARGNGEIWVEGNSKTYAAPVMIIHYIENHDYLPPKEFIDAVLGP